MNSYDALMFAISELIENQHAIDIDTYMVPVIETYRAHREAGGIWLKRVPCTTETRLMLNHLIPLVQYKDACYRLPQEVDDEL